MSFANLKLQLITIYRSSKHNNDLGTNQRLKDRLEKKKKTFGFSQITNSLVTFFVEISWLQSKYHTILLNYI